MKMDADDDHHHNKMHNDYNHNHVSSLPNNPVFTTILYESLPPMKHATKMLKHTEGG